MMCAIMELRYILATLPPDLAALVAMVAAAVRGCS